MLSKVKNAPKLAVVISKHKALDEIRSMMSHCYLLSPVHDVPLLSVVSCPPCLSASALIIGTEGAAGSIDATGIAATGDTTTRVVSTGSTIEGAHYSNNSVIPPSCSLRRWYAFDDPTIWVRSSLTSIWVSCPNQSTLTPLPRRGERGSEFSVGETPLTTTSRTTEHTTNIRPNPAKVQGMSLIP